MQSSTSNSVQLLKATDASRIHVGNTYNTTHNYHSETEQDDVEKYLRVLRPTNPRNKKIEIEERKGGLLKESYMWILEAPEFLAWRDEDHESRILWIRGDPGKGKTMLLCGIIDQLLPFSKLEKPESQMTLSYFFCQGTDSGLSSLTAVMRGLVYLLVIQQPCLVSHLKDAQRHGVVDWDSRVGLEGLFRKMIADPALQNTCLVVDALDECLQDLELLLKIISSTTQHVKWVVSSRNRHDIENGLEGLSKLGLSLELHEKSISRAVEYFINYHTRQLVDKKRLKRHVAHQVHHHLTQHAHGTFLWVALVCQQLEGCRPWEISEQLLDFPEGLDALYKRMIGQIEASKSSERYIRILAIASTVYRPLTFSEIIVMEQLSLAEEDLPDFISECGSFLTTKDKTILFVHQSAKDFLLKESSALLFQSGLAHHHYDFFQRSINVLQSLHKDMYHLFYPGISLTAAIRNRPEPDPLSSLAYATVFWADHLREAYQLSIQDGIETKLPFMETIHQFLSDKFLFWLEALSLCQNLPVAGKTLLFLKDLPTAFSQSDILALIEDALRFLALLSPVIGDYPLQIYVSGLLFSPHESLIRNKFEQYTPDFVSKSPKVDVAWSPFLSVLETTPKTVICTMSFSSTDEMLAITTSDSQLLIWRVSDGSMHKRSKYDDATLLTISPDLQSLAMITTRSSDAEGYVQDALQVLELDSNHALRIATLDGRKVVAMKFSPDSRWLALCFKDELYIFAREGGVPRSWPLKLDLQTDPSDSFPWRIEFASDCAALSILCFDPSYSIVALDLRTGVLYYGPNLEGDGHESDERINDAKFVPNTHLIMLCSDQMFIYLWDFLRGEWKEWHEHENYVDCLAYSHTNSWIATASHRDVILLCQDQRRPLRELQIPAANGLRAIEVAHDDTKIAVCSQTSIWILDVHIILADKISSDTEEDKFPYLMKDGITIAYHDIFNTIEIEDPIAGTIMTLDIRNSIRGSVRAIAFSSETQLLAFSDRSSIYVFDLKRAHLRYSFDIQAKAKYIAISSNVSSDRQWVAVCIPSQVLVLNVSTGHFQQSFEFPDKSGRHPATACFAGTKLGVSWCFHMLEHPDDNRDEIFILYDIETGQQLTHIDLPCSWLLLDSPGGNLSVSPDGKWTMSYVFKFRRLLLSDVEAGIHCAVVDVDAKQFSFIDNSTLWTDHGIFYLNRLLNNSTVKSRSDKAQIVKMKSQVIRQLPVISPTFDKYGRDNHCDWITLDTRPLIWLPQQYRLNTHTHLGKMAIGQHHIIIESSRGMYCIVLVSGAETLLRQAISDLSI